MPDARIAPAIRPPDIVFPLAAVDNEPMRDGPLRVAAKALALIRFEVDLWLTRAIRRFRGEPSFTLGGHCRACGFCCQTPEIRPHPVVYHLPALRWLFLLWQEKVNRFELLEVRRKERVFRFRCTHYDPDSRLCDSYRSRPGMCRDYPRLLLYSTNPQLHRECGYVAVHRRADQLKQALSTVELDDQQRQELERNLHLEG
jgi:Fe-S-cluster containining protein